VSALPVLRRHVHAQPNLISPFPTLAEVAPPGSQPAAVLGDVVTVSGSNLAGVTGVVVTNDRLGIAQTLTTLSNAGNISFQFTVPNPAPPVPALPNPTPSDLPAGVYLLSAQFGAVPATVTSNGLPFAIAPAIDPSWNPGTVASGSAVVVTIPCSPYVRTGQQVSFLIGDQEAPADLYTSATNSPSFTFPTLEPTGVAVPARLRVDGIDSPCISMANMPATPPTFSGPMVRVT